MDRLFLKNEDFTNIVWWKNLSELLGHPCCTFADVVISVSNSFPFLLLLPKSILDAIVKEKKSKIHIKS